MGQHAVVYDDEKQNLKRLPNNWPGFIDEDFDVEVNGQQDFDLVSGTITSENQIDVFENGWLKRETNDYVRDTENNRVSFTYPINEDTWIRVRMW